MDDARQLYTQAWLGTHRQPHPGTSVWNKCVEQVCGTSVWNKCVSRGHGDGGRLGITGMPEAAHAFLRQCEVQGGMHVSHMRPRGVRTRKHMHTRKHTRE
eukprot:364205-Chlamydomonas_euryale.AAC.5